MSTESSQRSMHWVKTRNLMIIHMVIWVFFSYVVHWIAPELNRFTFNDFPLGFYMAAQGSLVAFVVQLFVFNWQQERLDRYYGMAEDGDA